MSFGDLLAIKKLVSAIYDAEMSTIKILSILQFESKNCTVFFLVGCQWICRSKFGKR